MNWIEALTLAVVQGLTEFLPVSSSGHLAVFDAIFEALRGRPTGGGLFFAVMLHVGTLGAILVYYRRTIAAGARGLLTSGEHPGIPTRWAVVRSGLLASVATLPAVVVGLGFKDAVEAAFESRLTPAVGFLITSAVLFITSRQREGTKGPAETTWLDALLVGLAQAVAITPGISRSGSTIAAALALGFSRTWAVGFSLLMAVPAILGAAVLEGRDIDPSNLTPERIRITVASAALAGVVGLGAIAWLVRVVRAGRLWYFSVYLAILSGLVFASVLTTGGPSPGAESTRASAEATDGQGGRSETVDGTAGGGPGRSGGQRADTGDDLDRADSPGPRPAGPSTGPDPATAGSAP